jgi:hypothetical protein
VASTTGSEAKLPYKTGDQVRIPDMHGGGKVLATVVTPASPGRNPRFAWVRIEEGEEAGSNERVPYDEIEYA